MPKTSSRRPSRLLSKESACRLSGSSDDASASIRLHRRSAKQLMRPNGATMDRKQASKLLGVSVRTIDRYIRSGKLPAFTERGRIWLTKEGILEFRRGDIVPVKTTIDKVSSVSLRPSVTSSQDTSFYKDLYEEAKSALGEYQQKLEQANYRIGQLESHSVHPATVFKPMERQENSASYEFQRRELAEREKEIFALKELAKRERTSRIIFAILTYLLLILQPIFWYFLR